jgi:hypothetical protein
MFGLFKKKTEMEKLQAKYKALMEDSHALSKVDRTKSDAKVAEAESVLKQMESLR